MDFMSVRKLSHKFVVKELQKMGARFIDIKGTMFLVKFVIQGYKITYAYHLNSDNIFFLERVKPYVLPIGDFEEEEQVLAEIKEDIEQFKNAMRSSNFQQFVGIDSNITQLVRYFEDLYLYYNVEKEHLDMLHRSVNGILTDIKDIMSKSKRAYTKKDPQYLREDTEFDLESHKK